MLRNLIIGGALFLIILSGAMAYECFGDNGNYGALMAWSFDDADIPAGSNQNDKCGTTLGTGAGVTTGVTGAFNEAYSFDGANDVVYNSTTTICNFDTADSYSFNAWINFTANSGNRQVFGESDTATNKVSLRIHSTEKPDWYGNIGGDSFLSRDANARNNGNWHMITGVYYGNTTGCYYLNASNPVCTTDAGLNGNFFGVNTRLSAGARWDNGGGIWDEDYDGLIDEVSCYNQTLDQGGGNLTYLSNLYSYNNLTGLTGGAPPGNNAPVVTLVSPTPAHDYHTNTDFTINATVTDADADRTYALIDFVSQVSGEGDVVGWWEFENNMSDFSTHGHTLSIQGGAGYSAGVFNQSFSVTASGDKANVSLPAADFIDEASFSYWAMPTDATNGNQVIVAKGTTTPLNMTFAGFINATGSPCYGFTIGGVLNLQCANTVLNDGEWFHFVGSHADYNGGENTLIWINGSLLLNETIVGNPDVGEQVFTIGSDGSDTNNFTGLIDSVILINRTVLQAEVDSLFNATGISVSHVFSSSDYAEGIYNYTAWAVDTSIAVDSDSRGLVIDRTAPTVNIYTPTAAQNIFYGDSTNLNVTGTDTNMFNLTCDVHYTNGTLVTSYVNDTGSGTTFSLENQFTSTLSSATSGNVSYYLNCSAMDSHTANENPIEAYKVKEKIKFRNKKNGKYYESGNVTATVEIKEFSSSFVELYDRIKFSYDVELKNSVKDWVLTVPFNSDCPIHIVANSDYAGHMVTCEGWLDFEDAANEGWDVTLYRNDAYNVNVQFSKSFGNSRKTVTIDPATGGLNFGSAQNAFNIIEDSQLTTSATTFYVDTEGFLLMYYQNISDSVLITGASCNVTITDPYANSNTYTSSQFSAFYRANYTPTFTGTHNYNVTCARTGWSTQTDSGAFNVLSEPASSTVQLTAPTSLEGYTSKTCADNSTLRYTFASETCLEGSCYNITNTKDVFCELGCLEGGMCRRSVIREGGIFTVIVAGMLLIYCAWWLSRRYFR